MACFTLSGWFKAAQRKAGVSRRAPHRKPPRPRFVPRLEGLEGRLAPAVLTVNTLADETTPDKFLSLREAIGVVDSGSTAGLSSAELKQISGTLGQNDTIQFAHSLNGGTITLTHGELDITANLVIQGPGATKLSISGGNASRVFEIAAGFTVTLNGLAITHGYAPDQGGGILNDGSNLTLFGDDLTQNVVFESATAYALGGALQSLGGTLTITDCRITGNQALGASGPSVLGNAHGGGIYVLAGTATISNSTISGNLAQGGDNTSEGNASGGGLGIASSAVLTGCTVSGNQAVGGNGGTGPFVGEAYGGGISDFASVSVSACIFANNLALAGNDGNSGPGNLDPFPDYSFGGAIVAEYSTTLTITGSAFSHNQAIGGNNATASGTDIIGVGGAEGGAINSEVGAVATISDSTFDANLAQGGNGNTGSGPVVLVGEALGGAIVAGYGGSAVGSNTLTVSSSTFTANKAQGGDNNSGTGSVAGLVGVGAGAGIANYAGGTASVSGSLLALGEALGGHGNTAGGTGTVFANLGAGGGLFNFLGNYDSSGFGPLGASVVSISNSTLAGNLAQGGAGGNGTGGGIANLVAATTTVSDSTLTLNEAKGGKGGAGLGGGAYNDATSSLALTQSLVTLNQALGSPGIGGGIYTVGTFSADTLTLIVFNHASTSNDNIGP